MLFHKCMIMINVKRVVSFFLFFVRFSRTNVSLLCKVRFKTRPGNGYVMHVLEFISIYLYFKFPHKELNKSLLMKMCIFIPTFFIQFLAAPHQVTGCVKQNVWILVRAGWQEVGILFVYKNTMGFGTLTIFTCLFHVYTM